jgi:hypothetical protein
VVALMCPKVLVDSVAAAEWFQMTHHVPLTPATIRQWARRGHISCIGAEWPATTRRKSKNMNVRAGIPTSRRSRYHAAVQTTELSS